MNDKQQLAAMGEHMASMKLTIHGHGINSEEEASGGFLTRCLPCSSQQQQTPCMAKRIEELEAQVLVMADLLREARKYVTALGKPDDEVSAVQMTVSRIDALLAGQVPAPAAAEGWQLVPVEPTNGMLNAGYFTNNEANKSIYSSMLAAAPSPDSAK